MCASRRCPLSQSIHRRRLYAPSVPFRVKYFACEERPPTVFLFMFLHSRFPGVGEEAERRVRRA